MALVEEIRSILGKEEISKTTNDNYWRELNADLDYYKSLGLFKKQTYSIPRVSPSLRDYSSRQGKPKYKNIK